MMLSDRGGLSKVIDVGYYTKLEIQNESEIDYNDYRYLSDVQQDAYEGLFNLLGKVIEDINVDEDIMDIHVVDNILEDTYCFDWDNYNYEYFRSVYAPNYTQMAKERLYQAKMDGHILNDNENDFEVHF